MLLFHNILSVIKISSFFCTTAESALSYISILYTIGIASVRARIECPGLVQEFQFGHAHVLEFCHLVFGHSREEGGLGIIRKVTAASALDTFFRRFSMLFSQRVPGHAKRAPP